MNSRSCPFRFPSLWTWIVLALLLLCTVPALAKTAVQVLKEAAQRWQGIDDYTAYFRQRNIEPNGEKVFLGKLSLCRLSSEGERAYLRLDYFETTVDAGTQGPTVIQADKLRDLYFSDGETLWHYRPEENQVTMEWLTAGSPFPEVLLLAGFLKLDVEQFRKTHYFKPVITEPVLGENAYKIAIVPKGEAKGVEPVRELWLLEDSLLPARVRLDGEIRVVVDLWMQRTNQGLDPNSLVPLIPSNVARIDLRR